MRCRCCIAGLTGAQGPSAAPRSRRRSRRTSVALSALLLAVACSQPVDHAGGVTDTGNSYVATITGTVIDSSGTPVAGAAVTARPVDYFDLTMRSLSKAAARVRQSITDTDGAFVIDSLFAGEYRVHITADNLTAQFTQTVPAGDTVLQTGTHQVFLPAVITGAVAGPDSVLTPMQLHARLYGFDFQHALTRSNAFTFRLDSVPPGNHLLVISSPSGHYRSSIIAVDSLEPGEVRTVTIDSIYILGAEDPSRWRHSRQLLVRTGPSGANVQELLRRFPLLVRLDETSLRFDQARGDGADLRFTDESGAFIPHEIEYYDSLAARAAVWVRVDSIAPGDDSLLLTMHWGNYAAPDFSISADVFPTGDGYAGVWHMKRGLHDVFIDGTLNRYHGIPLVSRPTDTAHIGWGQLFDGAHDMVQVAGGPGLRVDSTFTCCAWVRIDRTQDGPHVVVSQKAHGDDTTGFELACNPSSSAGDSTVVMRGTGQATAAARAQWTDGWHMVAVRVRQGVASVFLDGQAIATDVPLSIAPGSGALTIGGRGGVAGFGGMLDELCIARRARSAEWIRLLWESQREGAGLVSWQ